MDSSTMSRHSPKQSMAQRQSSFLCSMLKPSFWEKATLSGMLLTGSIGMRRFIFMRLLLERSASDIPDPLAQNRSERGRLLLEVGGASELHRGTVLSEPPQELRRIVDLHAIGGQRAHPGSEVEDDADTRLRPQVRRGEI